MQARMKQMYVPTKAGIDHQPPRRRARSQQSRPPRTNVAQSSSLRLAIHATASARCGWTAQRAVRKKAATSAAPPAGATEAGAVARVETKSNATNNQNSKTAFSA